VQAVIEFALDGTILQANDNFLQAMGYRLEEIQGKHHSLFVDPEQARSAEYRDFWARLGRGEYDAGQYRRFGKGQREIWIQASYNPVLDRRGGRTRWSSSRPTSPRRSCRRPTRRGTGRDRQVAGGDRVQHGWPHPVGQRQLPGRHRLQPGRSAWAAPFVVCRARASQQHRVSPVLGETGRGEYDAGQYRRLGKGGREVWIQASYNPILDLNGKPFKVVKYATDITAQVHENQAMQRAVAQTREVVAAAKQGDLTRAWPPPTRTGRSPSCAKA
jgi:methyl-accepting chemotaxis protein